MKQPAKYNMSGIILFLIVISAFFLRIYNLSNLPPALNWDEISLGYNAYSILTTGRDEWGKFLPVIFQAYGDYKLPVYVYTLVPFVKIFGLNEFAIRIPSVLAGTLSVLLTYLIVYQLGRRDLRSGGGLNPEESTRNYSQINSNSSSRLPVTDHQALALFSALLVAIEPWSFFLSRPAFEANLALCFFLTGFYFFLRSQYAIYNILYTIFFFGLSVWTYNSYRIFTPLFMTLLIILYRKEIRLIFDKRPKLSTFYLLLTTVLFLPMFYQLFLGVGQERYRKVAIIDDGAVSQIVSLREKYHFPVAAERALFNRPSYFIYHFGKNVVCHFSIKYLFTEGGSNYQFSVPGFGVLYIINALFLIIGIIYLIKQKSRISILLLGWWILGAIPSSLTREAPHVLRSITILPAPMIITAVGIVHLFKIFTNPSFVSRIPYPVLLTRLLTALYIISLVISVRLYITNYFTQYRSAYSWSWQYGYKQAVEYINKNYGQYDKIVFTKKYGEPHEFVLFFTRWYPVRYISDKNLIRFEQSDWFWVDRFDKYYFVNDWDIPTEEWQPFILESRREDVDCRKIKCLLVTSPGNVPKTWKFLKSISFLDGSVAYEIYDNK